MALIKKQLLAKEDMLLSADNTPVSQARAGTIISVHPVNASVIPFDETKSIVEAVEDLAYTHPSKHPVSIIDGSSNPSKFVKTDTLGNTGFDIVTWAEVVGKPNTYTPNSHEHSLDEVTSGTLPASRVAISETRQFITAEQASQLLDMEVKSNKGMPNGYAPLDINGKINPSFLSALNLVEVFTPADLASMLALTSAQPGDIAYRQDNSTSYMLVALPASTEANWKSLNIGAQVISVNGQTGVVSLNTSNIAESTNLYFTNERVDNRVANLLQAGTNISLAYDDTSNTLTINANDTSVDWSEVQSKPTTISGYSITDAYTKTETNSALSLKAPLASPTFTGTVALPSTTSIGNVSSTELGYLDGVTSSIQTQFNGKVSKTGNETIAGVKTFTDSSLFLSPNNGTTGAIRLFDTEGNPDAVYIQALNNELNNQYGYLKFNKNGTITPSGDIVGNITMNAGTVTNGVYTIGNQTIAGVKTFSSSPIVPNATTATQAIAYGQAVKNTGDETIAGIKSFSSGIKIQNQNVSPFSGFKNYIINGNFDVWQRGTAFNNVLDQSYTADRWVYTRNGSGANVNIFKSEWAAGSSETGVGSTEGSIFEFAQTVAGSGCTYNTINQRIEGVQWSSQKTLTLSFNCEFLNSPDVLPQIIVRQYFGSGGSGIIDTVIATNISVNATAAWDKKSFTFTLPNITGKTIGTSPYVEIILCLPINKVFHFRLNAVQLEEGSVATPFENRPYGLELSLCQRYFYRFINPDALYRILSTTKMTTIPFPVSMRTAPTIITYMLEKDGVPQTENSGASIIQVSKEGVLFIVETFTTIVDVMYFSASAEL